MIIDFHTHIFPPFFREGRERFFPQEPAFEILYRPSKSRLVGRDELLRRMDEEGVERSVIFGFPWDREDHFRRHNDYILESVQHDPDRLIGFCSFSPLAPGASEEAERCLALGLAGVGELAIYGAEVADSHIEAFGEILETCRRYRVPLLLHSNEPVGHAYPGKTGIPLAWLYRFLKTYPENRIVLAHWGGGLFFYALMKREVREVLRHVWFDTAASPYLYRESIYGIAAKIIGLDRILLGTDYPLLKAGPYFEEMEAAGLSARDIRRIAGENAAHLLSLDS
jgi:predicted TIM-barrel fold metal-dependent hydrolase